MTFLALTVLASAIPFILAASGELITERSGVLNLGVEGMMLMGAVSALLASIMTGNPYFGIIAGGVAGLLAAVIFAFFAITLMTNQVATGLALTIFCLGLSGLIGAPLIGKTAPFLPPIKVPLLSELPVVGNLLFHQDLLFLSSIILIVAMTFFLNRTRSGMILRAVGDNPLNAHQLGYSVRLTRWLATCFGGFCAGLGGAYIPLVLTPHWLEGMTAGRGWIALALVVFASWIPWRVVVGGLIFSGITVMQLAGQAKGWTIPPQLLTMLPYLATIIALVILSTGIFGRGVSPPAYLGRGFNPDD